MKLILLVMERNDLDNVLTTLWNKKEMDLNKMQEIFNDDAIVLYRRFTVEFKGNIFEFYLHLPEIKKTRLYNYFFNV